MKFRLLCLLIGLLSFTNCSLEDNSIIKGAFSIFGNSKLFISCDGVVMNIKPEGEVYEKRKNRYIAIEMEEHTVLVTLKVKVVESLKLKRNKRH